MANILPEETLKAIKEFSVAIKGPLTTPVGGGMRSLNVGYPSATRSLYLSTPGAVL